VEIGVRVWGFRVRDYNSTYYSSATENLIQTLTEALKVATNGTSIIVVSGLEKRFKWTAHFSSIFSKVN
jgi:hypothetical protein